MNNIHPNVGRAPIEAFGLGLFGLGGKDRRKDEKKN